MLARALEADDGEAALQVGMDRRLHVRADTGVDRDADLVEAHERPAADPVYDDGIDQVLGERHDGSHAPALCVRRVGEHLDLADGAVFKVDEGETLTAAEVAGAARLEAAGQLGRDGDADTLVLVAHGGVSPFVIVGSVAAAAQPAALTAASLASAGTGTVAAASSGTVARAAGAGSAAPASAITAFARSPALADVFGAALRTGGLPPLAGVCPAGLAGEAAQAARLHTVLAAADEDGLAPHEGLCHAGAATLEHAPDGLAGDAHDLGGLFMAQALEIDESDGLELVDAELQLLELASGHAGRLEQRDARHT
jgi:hypothetical protein